VTRSPAPRLPGVPDDIEIMRVLFTVASLLIVVAIVALSARHQLSATRLVAPSGASASQVGSSRPDVAQFQRELDRTLQEGAAARASAADAAETQR